MNILFDCDCWLYNDIFVVFDIGIAVLFDFVVFDKVCVDFVNEVIFILVGFVFEKVKYIEVDGKIDRFKSIYFDIDWRVVLKYV